MTKLVWERCRRPRETEDANPPVQSNRKRLKRLIASLAKDPELLAFAERCRAERPKRNR